MRWFAYRKRWQEAQALADRLAWENNLLVDELHRREGQERVAKVLMDNYGFTMEPAPLAYQRRLDEVEAMVKSRKLKPPEGGHL